MNWTSIFVCCVRYQIHKVHLQYICGQAAKVLLITVVMAFINIFSNYYPVYNFIIVKTAADSLLTFINIQNISQLGRLAVTIARIIAFL
jgi:hypothetical protein